MACPSATDGAEADRAQNQFRLVSGATTARLPRNCNLTDALPLDNHRAPDRRMARRPEVTPLASALRLSQLGGLPAETTSNVGLLAGLMARLKSIRTIRGAIPLADVSRRFLAILTPARWPGCRDGTPDLLGGPG